MIRFTKFILPILAGIMMSFILMFFPEPAHAADYYSELDEYNGYSAFYSYYLFDERWCLFVEADGGGFGTDVSDVFDNYLLEHENPNFSAEFILECVDYLWHKGDTNLFFKFEFDAYGENLGQYGGFEDGRIFYLTSDGGWDTLGDVHIMTDAYGSQYVEFYGDIAPADIDLVRIVLYGDLNFGWSDMNLYDCETDELTFTSAYDVFFGGSEYTPVTTPEDFYGESVNTSKSIFQIVRDIFDSLFDLPGRIASSVSYYFQDVSEAIKALPGQLKGYFDSVVSAVSGLPAKLKVYFDNLQTAVSQLPNNLKEYFDSVVSEITSLPGKIEVFFDNLVTDLENLLTRLFVPDEEVLRNLVDSFYAKFPWIEIIMSSVSTLYNLLLDVSDGSCPEPYVVNFEYMDKPMSVTILDLSWYEPYKPTVDFFLTGFIIFGFIWNLFFHIPGILGGLPAVISNAPTDAGNSGSADVKGGSGKGGTK